MHGHMNVKQLCRSGTSGHCSIPLHVSAVHISLHQRGHWFAKRAKGERPQVTKSKRKVTINNYNSLTLLPHNGTLKVQSKLYCAGFQSFTPFSSLCHIVSLATSDLIVTVFSISSVLSVFSSYSLSSYCWRMLQTAGRPAAKLQSTRCHKLVLIIIYYPIFVTSITTSLAHESVRNCAVRQYYMRKIQWP
jgi:hypothetical protein